MIVPYKAVWQKELTTEATGAGCVAHHRLPQPLVLRKRGLLPVRRRHNLLAAVSRFARRRGQQQWHKGEALCASGSEPGSFNVFGAAWHSHLHGNQPRQERETKKLS